MVDSNGMRVSVLDEQWYEDMNRLINALIGPVSFEALKRDRELRVVIDLLERRVPLCKIKIIGGALVPQKLNPPRCDY